MTMNATSSPSRNTPLKEMVKAYQSKLDAAAVACSSATSRS